MGQYEQPGLSIAGAARLRASYVTVSTGDVTVAPPPLRGFIFPDRPPPGVFLGVQTIALLLLLTQLAADASERCHDGINWCSQRVARSVVNQIYRIIPRNNAHFLMW